MPNFLVIGAAKAGTTAIFHYLKEHPQIYMSPHKEPRFFALMGEPLNFQGPGDLTRFKFVTDMEAYRELFEGVSTEIAIGEVSPWYLYRPKVAERIKQHLPNAKLIAILRDPVERAYSNFLHASQEGLEPLSDFSEAMLAEPERILNNWSPRWHYKQKGFYYVQLKRYFDQFDHSQIKVYLYDDFKENPLAVLKDIFTFLGVDNTFVPDTSKKHNISKLSRNTTLDLLLRRPNRMKSILKPLLLPGFRKYIKANLNTLNEKEKPQLSPEVRSQFIQEYQEDILKLQELINRDLSKWLEIR
ncbi:MAG: sulfotransferase [Leptolyngbyaceae cyanobacterium MO_188.B28]|nr:sulfotransferase [Leptolyngbyaceae cyanobacterium MO_188.B28]